MRLYMALAVHEDSIAPVVLPSDHMTIGIFQPSIADAEALAKRYIERTNFSSVIITSIDATTHNVISRDFP